MRERVDNTESDEALYMHGSTQKKRSFLNHDIASPTIGRKCAGRTTKVRIVTMIWDPRSAHRGSHQRILHSGSASYENTEVLNGVAPESLVASA
eukprot:3429049-Pleurochrysis_carterae.AAC.1